MSRDAGVRTGTLLAVAAASGLVCWLLLRLWRSGGRELPELPWLALLPLLLLAGLVLAAGWQVRRYVSSPSRELAGPRRVSPQRARGTLVAAQASALGGAVLVGWYLANAGTHLPNADVTSVRELMVRALACAAGALVLAVCGMVAQWMCRIPEGHDDDEPPERDLSYAVD